MAIDRLDDSSDTDAEKTDKPSPERRRRPPPDQPGVEGFPSRADSRRGAAAANSTDRQQPAMPRPEAAQPSEAPGEQNDISAKDQPPASTDTRPNGSTESPAEDTDTADRQADATGPSPDNAIDDQAENWLDRTDRPPPLKSGRPYDRPGGLDREKSEEQQALENAVPRDDSGTPKRFPDPRERWKDLLNGEGFETNPFRANNCLDCSLAGISTWHGEPQVSAPRHAEYDSLGRPSTDGEAGGPHRAQSWLGHEYDHMGAGKDAYAEIEAKLRDGGHGSSAAILNSWPTGGAHAWNAFNRNGEVIWVDFQQRTVDDKPLYVNVSHLWCIAIDREGKKL